ncbi:MAG: HNH endonuclease [Acidobacteria bacterium]|nr:HNH endonuclease [Acidobacteriota bacterium]
MKRARRKIPAALERKLRQQGRNRCGYCLSSEVLIGMPMEIEHLLPVASGGQSVEANLWLCCRRCNEFKGAQTQGIDPHTLDTVALFNPREQVWSEHFQWSEDGTEIIGQTPSGRATVIALKLNNSIIVVTRRQWASVGWFPPTE